MPRKSNWPALLSLFLQEKQTQPFDWQHNNCCFFASDWICILTGIDPAADLRPLVIDAATAKKVLISHGGVELIAQDRCSDHGWPEINPALAQRGDVATVDTDHGPALGVVFGRQVAYAGLDGVAMVPLAETKRAWRIR